MPVFVIGMKRFPERYKRTLKQLGDAGIDAQFFPGVDLVGGDALAPDEKINPYPRLLTIGRSPGLGEIGCHFAHYRLLKHILTLKAPRALILECDAAALPFAKELIDEVAALDEKHELVYLCSHCEPRGDTLRTLSHNHVLRRCLGPEYGMMAYAITRPAIEKFLPQMTPMRGPCDTLLGKPYCTGLETFSVWPFAFQTSSDKSNSIIRNRNPRWTPSSPVHRAFYRMLCALLAKPIYNSNWNRWIKPFRPKFWRRRLYWRRLKNRGGGGEINARKFCRTNLKIFVMRGKAK